MSLRSLYPKSQYIPESSTFSIVTSYFQNNSYAFFQFDSVYNNENRVSLITTVIPYS